MKTCYTFRKGVKVLGGLYFVFFAILIPFLLLILFGIIVLIKVFTKSKK